MPLLCVCLLVGGTAGVLFLVVCLALCVAVSLPSLVARLAWSSLVALALPLLLSVSLLVCTPGPLGVCTSGTEVATTCLLLLRAKRRPGTRVAT